MRAKDAQPSRQCQLSAGNVSSPFPSISSALPQEEQRRACFIVATNILEATELSVEELVGSYKQQGSVERGFRFLKDPLFLASSVFVKKPERIVALGFIMVLCLLVYRFAESRLRTQLKQTGQTLPNQLNKQTSTPTMRLAGPASCSTFSPFTNRC